MLTGIFYVLIVSVISLIFGIAHFYLQQYLLNNVKNGYYLILSLSSALIFYLLTILSIFFLLLMAVNLNEKI